MKKFKQKGFTLVEIIVSIALLSIVLLVLSTTFMTSFNIMNMASNNTKDSNNVAAGIELATASAASYAAGVTVNPSSGTFPITFGSTNVTVSGNYLQGSTTSSSITFKSFIPN
jgi:prepilin-type N-terminal cleavage/methylation domain-containing protein